MEDITRNSGCQNMTGYSKLFCAYVEELEEINKVNESTVRYYFLTNGKFGEIECYNIKVDTAQKSDNYTHKITCDFRSKANRDILFNMMTKKRFVVMTVDNNSNRHLYGNKEEPLHFSFDFIGNPQPSQPKEYKLTFYGNNTFTALQIGNN